MSLFRPISFQRLRFAAPLLLACSFALPIGLAAQGPAEDGIDAGTNPPPVVSEPAESGPASLWGLKFAPIPESLRMHLPMLPASGGLLVAEVEPSGRAAAEGILRHDLLIEADGGMLRTEADLPPADRPARWLIVRRGNLQPLLNHPAVTPPWFPRHPRMPHPGPWGFFGGNDRSAQRQAIPGLGIESRAYASASSSGQESMSVSRAGENYSIEISGRSTGGASLHFQGTAVEIEAQLAGGDVSPEVRQRVLEAIGQ